MPPVLPVNEPLTFAGEENVTPPSSECEVFVPSGFSPDGNGLNDQACVLGACIKESDFKIFDRRSRWFSEHDPEGVAFGCPVLAHDLARKQRRSTLAPQLALIGHSRPIFDDK